MMQVHQVFFDRQKWTKAKAYKWLDERVSWPELKTDQTELMSTSKSYVLNLSPKGIDPQRRVIHLPCKKIGITYKLSFSY